MMTFKKVGGRKYITGVACLAVEITLLCVGLISELVFKELFILTFLVSVGGNVLQKIWVKKGDK